MKLECAKERIGQYIGRPLIDWVSDEQFKDIIKNKGKTGQLLELALGLNLSSSKLDFEDGELKTNKCDNLGNPLETIFITQIATDIDKLLSAEKFESSRLFEKTDNMLYVPVCKVGPERNWKIIDCIHVDFNNPKYDDLRKQLEVDYYNICGQLRAHIETGKDRFIHTSNGKLIQIRSKDSKPYHPIYSSIYKGNVSNKNHAFYFKKEFVYEVYKINR